MFSSISQRMLQSGSRATRVALGTATALAVGGGVGGYCLQKNAAKANMIEDGIHPASYPFDQKTILGGFDHASIRRGFTVFQEICASCHSLNFVHWRQLVNVAFTESELKEMAADVQYEDGPNDQGEMFMRPGLLADPLPKPFKNEQAARAANMGAYPPDLSLITKARHGGVDYLYSLLTGYKDLPPGEAEREGLHYNPYFPGGHIAMAQNIYDGVVEFEDGTPATASQIAKDVSSFLSWASEPELEERKLQGIKVISIASMLFVISIWIKNHRWAGLKHHQLIFKDPSAWNKHTPGKK